MKKTQTIDRTLTPKSGTVQPGMITELMTSCDTCATEHLLGTYCTLLPAGQSRDAQAPSGRVCLVSCERKNT